MSRREEFKTRMKEFKLYKDTTGKGYWEWKLHSKVSSYALGGDNEGDGEDDDVFAQFIKENPIQPGSVAPKDLVELNRMQNLPYELNEYQKQFAKSWYTQRSKYSKYDSLLGNGKLGRILETIDKSTYLTIPEFAETELKEYMRINNIDKPLHPMEIELKSELLLKKDAMGFARPNAYAWHVKPKTIKTPKRDYRGLGWHEGIGHIVGDNSTEIIGSAPKIWVKNQSGDKEYEKYINKQNEQHASTWEFRGANAEMLDDNGKRYIDPNRQLTPSDVRRMIEKGATIPVEWQNSNLTESDIANFHNSFAYEDKPQDTFDFNVSNSANEVFFGKNGGLIPAYGGGGTNEDRQTSIVTNTVKKALERGDILLVLRILKRGNKEDRKFYYPDNGSILSVLNIYDTPLLGDALSLLDALKYSVKGDWDNASLSYMDAVSPLALFSRSKLNWKGWGAKKKYIPEYEAIEREAKKNGTWLKNADSTDFTGDPREWVVKRSKKFREAFGDKYLEGYTGMRSPYNPKELLDTYLSSRERAYTYTPNKNLVKKKGDTGIAKLVVPDTDTYTVDALGNDWLHLTDKSINPYNFTNTNLIVSSILTPVISFKNIRDDGPFGMRDIAEDQFVAKSTTPRKSVLYNNGDFDLSNPDIFKTTIPAYIGYKLYNKANRENTQSYAIGGETENSTDDRTDHPISVTQNLDKVLSVADFTDRITHTDPNIGEYNPFYNASDDTYGIVPLQEVSVTAPWTKLGRNNADARRGMHYMQLGLEDAAKVVAPIVAGAVLPAMASTGLLGKAVDLASIATNPLDPLNYVPYTHLVPKVRLATQTVEDNLLLLLDIVNVNKAVEKMKSFYLSDEYYKRLKQAYNITGKKVFANQYLAYVLNDDLNKGVVVAPRFTKKGILGLTRFNKTYLRPEIALSKTLKPERTSSVIDHEVAHASLKGDKAVKQVVRNIDPYNKSIANLRPATEIYKNLQLKDTKSLTDAMNYNLYETDIDEIRSRAYLLFLQAKEQNLDVDSFIDKFIFKDPSTPFGKLNTPEELDDLLRIMAPNDIKYFMKSFLAVPPALLLLNKGNKTEQQINNSN